MATKDPIETQVEKINEHLKLGHLVIYDNHVIIKNPLQYTPNEVSYTIGRGIYVIWNRESDSSKLDNFKFYQEIV